MYTREWKDVTQLKRVTWALLVLVLLSMPCAMAATADDAISYRAKISVSADKTVSVAETLTFVNPPADGTFVHHVRAMVGGQTDTIANVRVQGCASAIAQTNSGVEITLSSVTDAVQITYERITAPDTSTTEDALAVLLLPASNHTIRTAIVSLVMPSRFDAQSVSIELPKSASFDYSVTAGVLSGSLLAPLPSGTPIFVRLSLPDGYFVRPAIAAGAQQQALPASEPSVDGIHRILLVVIVLLCALGVLVFALSRGRGTQNTPGAWCDPAQAGYVLRGFSKNGDLVALLPYWASLGIIRMELLQDRRIQFTRLAQLPENSSAAQRGLFAALFGGGDELTLGHLPAGFRVKANQARTELALVFDQDNFRIFTKASYRAKGVLVISLCLAFAVLICCALPMGGDYAFVSSIWMSIALSLLSLLGLIPLLDRLFAARALSATGRVLCVVGLLLFFAVVVALATVAHWLHPQLIELATVSGAACVLLAILYLFSRRRTHAGLQQLQMINTLLQDLRDPSPNRQPADYALLYSHAISLGVPIAADNEPWGSDVTRTLRDMQKIWNKLARAIIPGWLPYTR